MNSRMMPGTGQFMMLNQKKNIAFGPLSASRIKHSSRKNKCLSSN